jgi:hypothetical protein
MRHVHRIIGNGALVAPQVIGHTRSGVPVWSLAGGAGDDDGGAGDDDDGQDDDDGGAGDDDDGQDDGQDDDEGQDDDDRKLGPKGEKALAALKAERRELKRQLREARRNTSSSSDGDGDDQDDDEDPEKVRDRIRAELAAEHAQDRALDKLEARAAKLFEDPEDARALLTRSADDFLDDKGNPDVEAIDEALEDLLERKPHLAAQRGDDKKWKGSGDGGAKRSKPTRPKTLGDAVGRAYKAGTS